MATTEKSPNLSPEASIDTGPAMPEEQYICMYYVCVYILN